MLTGLLLSYLLSLAMLVSPTADTDDGGTGIPPNATTVTVDDGGTGHPPTNS